MMAEANSFPVEIEEMVFADHSTNAVTYSEWKPMQQQGKQKQTKKKIIAVMIALVLVVGIDAMVNIHKVNNLPFKVGDPYDKAVHYMKLHASDFEYGYSLNHCYGRFDYLGTGDQVHQTVRVFADESDPDTIAGIQVDEVEKCQDRIVKRLQKVYDIDDADISVDEDASTMIMNDDEVTITIEPSFFVSDVPDYRIREYGDDEGVISVRIEEK